MCVYGIALENKACNSKNITEYYKVVVFNSDRNSASGKLFNLYKTL